MKTLTAKKYIVGGMLIVLAGGVHAELTSQSKGLLEATGINEFEFMQNLHLTAGGWVSAGVTYNANDPADKFNGPNAYSERDSEL